MKHIIAAFSENHVIGHKGKLPWGGNLPADMKHFKDITLGSAVIMGRLTYESIRRPLPNRLNIVVSRKTLKLAGCVVVMGIEEAFEAGKEKKDQFVIGGEQIYKLALPYVDSLHLTKIDTVCDGDAYFPQIEPSDWSLESAQSHEADSSNKFGYTFLHYLRK